MEKLLKVIVNSTTGLVHKYMDEIQAFEGKPDEIFLSDGFELVDVISAPKGKVTGSYYVKDNVITPSFIFQVITNDLGESKVNEEHFIPEGWYASTHLPTELNRDISHKMRYEEGLNLPADFPKAVKNCCKDIIYSTLSEETQKNVLMAVALDSKENKPKLQAMKTWIDAMRSRCAELIEANDLNYYLAEKWPVIDDATIQDLKSL